MAELSREFIKSNIDKTRPFLGFAPLFAWHFCFWFAPTSFPFAELLSDEITGAWLIYLLSSVIVLLVSAAVLRNKRRLRSEGNLYVLAPVALCTLSLLFSFGMAAIGSPLQMYVAAIFLGAVESFCFLLWGERLASTECDATSTAAVVAIGSVVFASFLFTMLLPGVLAPAFVAALPLISGLVLVREGSPQPDAKILKPQAVRKRADRNIAIVSVVSGIVSLACFFLLTIIPSTNLLGGEWSYGYGVASGMLAIIIVAAVVNALSKDDNPFHIIPWLLIMVIIAFALFLGLHDIPGALGFSFFFTAFVYASFEMLLMTYFVVIAQNGRASSAIAIGVSLALFRLGVLMGDVASLSIESAGLEASTLVDLIASGLLCVVAVLLIPLISEGRYMEELTSKPTEVGLSALIRSCDETAKEFGLSPREREVLELFVQGYTVDNIAEKLVISPYTVRAHIRHLYEKTQMHKKSELICYVKDQVAHYSE